MGGVFSYRWLEEARDAGLSRHRAASLAGKASQGKTKTPRIAEIVETTEKAQTKEEYKKKELVWPAWAGEQVRSKWDEFKEYRRGLDNFRYKSYASEQAAVKTLAKYFANGKQAYDALDEAMARGWKFPVDPKERKTSSAKPELALSPTAKPWMQ